MSKLSGGEILVRALRAQGVRCIFTLSGNHLLPVYDALIGTDVRLIDTRHEGAAAHMADAWARVTGEPGVVLVTGGPGHTNAVTGIATAQGAESPVLWLSGASEYGLKEAGAAQEVDQVGVAAPVTKWAREATDMRRLPELVATGLRIAQTGRPGPVHISLPTDLLDSTYQEDGIAFPGRVDWRRATRTPANPALVDRAIELLARAERPAIVAGAGAWWSEAGPALRALIEATNVPLFTIDTARGIVSDDHPLCFGYPDPLLNPAGETLGRADLIVLLGRRLDFRLRYGQMFGPDCAIVHVEAEPADLGGSRRPELSIAGSPAAVAEQLLTGAARYRWPRRAWLNELEDARAAHRRQLAQAEASDARPIHPLRIDREIRAVLGDDYVLTFDAGDFIQWSRRALPARQPSSWIRLGPLWTLGSAIPFAVAAKVARPAARVFALTGDGGAGFYGFELDTAVRHNIPIVAVVANDAGWGMERQLQIGIYGADRTLAADLQPTRYDQIAATLGAHGEHVEDPADLRPALERAIASGKPACVDVTTAGVPSPQTHASIQRKLSRR